MAKIDAVLYRVDAGIGYVSEYNFLGKNMRTWVCLVCGWIYEEEMGWPEDGITPGTRWEDVPADWTCPECGVAKADFEMVVI